MPNRGVRSNASLVSQRSFTEWMLDLASGALGLVLVPIATSAVALTVMDTLWPSSRALLALPAWAAFCVSFVLLDYVQYWAHRFWHHPSLWPVHVLHHTLARMDGVGALRHSVWEPVFNPATWIHGCIFYMLADGSAYLIGLSTGLILDVWRHSEMPAHAQHRLARWLRSVLVTPAAHAMHHEERPRSVNFGSNLIIWDRWHRTYAAPAPVQMPLGVGLPRRPFSLLLWPARTLPSRLTASHAG